MATVFLPFEFIFITGENFIISLRHLFIKSNSILFSLLWYVWDCTRLVFKENLFPLFAALLLKHESFLHSQL